MELTSKDFKIEWYYAQMFLNACFCQVVFQCQLLFVACSSFPFLQLVRLVTILCIFCMHFDLVVCFTKLNRKHKGEGERLK